MKRTSLVLPFSGSRPAAFAAVFLIALTARLLFVFVGLPFAQRHVPGFHSVPGLAFDGYAEIAHQLVSGHGFALSESSGPTAARPPLLPFVLAFLELVFGPGAGPALVANALFGALTCSLTTLIGWRVLSPAIGILAGLMLAFYPPHLWWSQYILSETLLTLLLTASVLALVAFVQAPSARAGLLAGVPIGLAGLCNPIILPFAVLFPALMMLFGRPPARATLVRGALLVPLAAGLVILPWTLRNARTFHAFIPVSWRIGFESLKGTLIARELRLRPDANLARADEAATLRIVELLREHGFRHGTLQEQYQTTHVTMTVSLQEDALLWTLWQEAARQDPWGEVRKVMLNLRLYWTFTIRNAQGMVALNLALLGLCVVGIVARVDRRLDRWLVVLFPTYLYLMYSAIVASMRYSLQVMPCILVFAVAGGLWLFDRVRGAWRRPSPSPA